MHIFKKPFSLVLVIVFISSMFLLSACSEDISSYKNTPVNNNLLIHYIDVGQADSMLIQVNGKNVLIDAGNKAHGTKLVSYIKKQGVKKLDIVIATHPHEDHIGGMSAILNNFAIADFYAPKKSSPAKVFEDMVNALNGKKIITAKAGINLDLDENAKLEFIAPNSSIYEDTNDYSAVVKLTYGSNSFLFMGDAQKLSENEILKANYDLRSDVLKVSHHGSSTSSSKAFLDKVNPKTAIISCGKNNDYGHPHKETLTELKKRNLKLYRTDIDGTIILESDGKAIKKL